MKPEFVIDGRSIGANHEPYIIAEMSANHNGDIKRALKIIEEAKSAGAHALKIQTYRPDTITIDSDLPDFQISDGLWKGRTLYSLYEWAHTPWEWHKELFEHARHLGITLFSSPFDHTAVDLLEDLNAPAYKIASFEMTDIPLVKYVAQTGKPLIISTGMANAEEIQETVDAVESCGCKQYALLHCVSGYPSPAEDYNLRTIPDMGERFGCVVGLSDHTLGNVTALASVALGASIIEKHFILSRADGGPDSAFSLEPDELKSLCADSGVAWSSLGSVNYERKDSEKGNVRFRRSLYFVRDVKKGEPVSKECIKSIRPGFGIPPKYFDDVIGKKVNVDVKRGDRVTFDVLE